MPQNDPGKDIDRKMQVGPELFRIAEHEGRIVATLLSGYERHRGWINYHYLFCGSRHFPANASYSRQL